MAKFFYSVSWLLLHLSTLFGYASAAALGQIQPLDNMKDIRITPGPGLPSLESLGLTVEMLAEEAFSDKQAGGNSTAALQKRFTDHCGTKPMDGWADTPAGLAGLCIAYVARLGSSSCAITGETTYCVTTSGHWFAAVRGIPLAGPTQSACRDVARGAQWIADNCAYEQLTGGQQNNRIRRESQAAAWGNGNLIVEITGYNGP